MIRRDIAFPFRIENGQAACADYPAHVRQMVKQVLLTDPGERVCLPEFGAGLRRVLFAPIGPDITASTELAVRQAVDKWLGDQVDILSVKVAQPQEGRIDIAVTYELIETRSQDEATVELNA